MGDVLLVMTTTKPSAKMPATPNFCFSGRLSFITMEIGRQMIKMSVLMLTAHWWSTKVSGVICKEGAYK